MSSRDNILALRVEHDVAEGGLLAGGRVAGEHDAGPGVLAAVPEDHRLDGDRRPKVVGDALAPAVRPGTITGP